MKKLSEIRAALGYTQLDLARLTSLSQSRISMIESGRTFPNAITRLRIQQALEQPVDWIATKLSGEKVNLSNVPKQETHEDIIIRQMEVFAKQAESEIEEVERWAFLANYTRKRAEKEQLLNKTKRKLKGEDVEFTPNELFILQLVHNRKRKLQTN